VGTLGSTNRAAIFAGGDVTDGARTVADALGAGKRAAIGIDAFLRRTADGGEPAGAPWDDDDVDIPSLRFAGGNVSAARWTASDPVLRVAPLNTAITFEELNLNHFARVSVAEDRVLPVTEALSGFAEVNVGLSPVEALSEARRCLNCGVCTQCDLCLIFCPDVAISRNDLGRYDIALDYCKGCGVCAAECPRGAILMSRDVS
jgi:2-oxoacid:acceptor oxidoreductase delta subunit (pyruvate/2-ketoisovalerate family)